MTLSARKHRLRCTATHRHDTCFLVWMWCLCYTSTVYSYTHLSLCNNEIEAIRFGAFHPCHYGSAVVGRYTHTHSQSHSSPQFFFPSNHRRTTSSALEGKTELLAAFAFASPASVDCLKRIFQWQNVDSYQPDTGIFFSRNREIHFTFSHSIHCSSMHQTILLFATKPMPIKWHIN